MEYLNSKPRKGHGVHFAYVLLSVFGAAPKKSLQVTSRSLLGPPGSYLKQLHGVLRKSLAVPWDFITIKPQSSTELSTPQ
eukprot:6265635-Heterocapsa_arctica.AAC.1